MPTTLIDTDTLAEWLAGDQPPLVLDTRARLGDAAAGAALWGEGHVPGAQHADLDRDLSSAPTREGGRHPLPAKDTFAACLRAWGITPQRRVVIYDDTGGRLAGARAWWLLRWAGHERVYLLDGGWPAWHAAGQAVETDAGAPPMPSEWEPVFDDSMIATTAEVARGEAVLLDARAGERYRGEQEPMDARAGHIPGAINVPGAELLDAETKRFITRDELAAALPDDANVIAYCGSGVSACQLILACAELGRPLPRLYPGSWSAWSADPSRPAATRDAI